MTLKERRECWHGSIRLEPPDQAVPRSAENDKDVGAEVQTASEVRTFKGLGIDEDN